MDAVESGKRFGFVMRHFETGNAQSESVRKSLDRSQGREVFSSPLSLAHFP